MNKDIGREATNRLYRFFLIQLLCVLKKNTNFATVVTVTTVTKISIMKFYDRQEEIAELRRIEQQAFTTHSRFTVVTGRRRIGKTSLIRRAFDQSTTAYLFVSRDNEAVIVKRFAQEVRESLGVFIPEGIVSFRDLFTTLMEAGKTMHFNLVIDEFQDFTYVNEAIFSHIQDVWDRYKDVSQVNLVVCGSAYRMMNRIFEDRKEPLFGRRDALLKLAPFGIATIKEILGDYKPDYTHEDLLALYAYTGGVPKYIETFMDDGATSRDDMIAMMTRSNSLFLNEGKNILIEEFGKDYGTYFSILGCISAGINTQAQIEDMLGGVSTGGHLKRLLEDYSLIARVRPFAAPLGTKGVRYEISDLFLRFWFRYVHRNRSIVEIENWRLLRKIITDDYTTYTGDVLERYFRQKMVESMEYRALGNWWDPRNKEDQCEIDIIAISADGTNMEFVEVKRNAERYKPALLREKVDYFLSRNKQYNKYNHQLHCLSMDDM